MAAGSVCTEEEYLLGEVQNYLFLKKWEVRLGIKSFVHFILHVWRMNANQFTEMFWINHESNIK